VDNSTDDLVLALRRTESFSKIMRDSSHFFLPNVQVRPLWGSAAVSRAESKVLCDLKPTQAWAALLEKAFAGQEAEYEGIRSLCGNRSESSDPTEFPTRDISGCPICTGTFVAAAKGVLESIVE